MGITVQSFRQSLLKCIYGVALDFMHMKIDRSSCVKYEKGDCSGKLSDAALKNQTLDSCEGGLTILDSHVKRKATRTHFLNFHLLCGTTEENCCKKTPSLSLWFLEKITKCRWKIPTLMSYPWTRHFKGIQPAFSLAKPSIGCPVGAKRLCRPVVDFNMR